MAARIYSYGILYNLNFIPWMAITFLGLIMVNVLPSSNKLPGYAFVYAWGCFACYLWLKEKRKVAQKVYVDGECICASGYFTKNTRIAWKDVESLTHYGKGLFFVSGKMEKTLYAEVISKNKSKIVIRRDIHDFAELISLIETQTVKSFVTI